MTPPASRPLFTILYSLFTAALCAASASAAAFSPLQIGLGSPDWQLVSEDTPVYGLRLNLPGSFNDTVAGLDLGLLSDDATTFTGLRLNAVSYSHTCNGIAIALFDMAAFLNGVQIAPLAIAGNACGLQIGLGTDARELHGVQIGLLNIVPDSPLPILPLLRASF